MGCSVTPQQEIRLYEYINGLVGLPFEYGKNDCPLLAAGALDCMDGGARRAEMTGLWHDRASAWKYIRRHGDIDKHLEDFGCREVAGGLAFAQVGDCLLMNRELAHDRRWHSVAVCLGRTAAVMTEELGLLKIRLDDLPTTHKVMRWPSQQ